MSAYRGGFAHLLPYPEPDKGLNAEIAPGCIPIYEGVYAQGEIVMTLAGDGVHAAESCTPVTLKPLKG